MLDIDHFKNVNDRYGHTAGDHVLVEIARLGEQNVRNFDTVCRYGGEEFVILLPEINRESAAQAAERLRQIIADKTFIVEAFRLSVTISLGVATLEFSKEGTEIAQAIDLDKLIVQADQALYASKQSGRNRVTHWSELSSANRSLHAKNPN